MAKEDYEVRMGDDETFYSAPRLSPHEFSNRTQEEIDDARAALNQRILTLQKRITDNLSPSIGPEAAGSVLSHPLFSEGDDADHLNSYGYNAIIDNALKGLGTSVDEEVGQVRDFMEMMKAIPNDANPQQIRIPGMTDTTMNMIIQGRETIGESTDPRELENVSFPVETYSTTRSERDAFLDALEEVEYDYGRGRLRGIIDVLWDTAVGEERTMLAMDLVLDYGMQKGDFHKLGLRTDDIPESVWTATKEKKSIAVDPEEVIELEMIDGPPVRGTRAELTEQGFLPEPIVYDPDDPTTAIIRIGVDSVPVPDGITTTGSAPLSVSLEDGTVIDLPVDGEVLEDIDFDAYLEGLPPEQRQLAEAMNDPERFARVQGTSLEELWIERRHREHQLKNLRQSIYNMNNLRQEDLNAGITAVFNQKFGTEYENFSGIMKGWLDGNLSKKQERWFIDKYYRMQRYLPSGGSSSSQTTLQKLETAGGDVAAGRLPSSQNEPRMAILTGDIPWSTIEEAMANPMAYPQINNSIAELRYAFGQRMYAQARRSAANPAVAQMVLNERADELTPEQRVGWEAISKGDGSIDPAPELVAMIQPPEEILMTFLQGVASGAPVLADNNIEFAGFLGHYVGQSYDRIKGAEHNANLKALVKHALLSIEEIQSGHYGPATAAGLNFLMGLHMGAMQTGNMNFFRDTLRDVGGLSPHAAYPMELFFHAAREKLGPNFDTATPEMMYDMLRDVDGRWLGLLNVVSFVADATSADVEARLHPDVRRAVGAVAAVSITSAELDGLFDPEERLTATQSQALGTTALDDFLRFGSRIGLFARDADSDEMIETLWKEFEPDMARFLPAEAEEWGDGNEGTMKKLAYSLRIFQSEDNLTRAFQGAMLTVAINNSDVNTPYRMTSSDLAHLVSVYLTRRNTAIIPVSNDDGVIMPKIVPANPNPETGWTGQVGWDTSGEVNGVPESDLFVVNAHRWAGLPYTEGVPNNELRNKTIGILVRNYSNRQATINPQGDLTEAEILRFATEVYNESLSMGDPSNNISPPDLIEMHFMMANKLVEAGRANGVIELLDEWGTAHSEVNRLQGLRFRIIPDSTPVTGSTLGRRGIPHIRVSESRIYEERETRFWREPESRQVDVQTFDVPWWNITDADYAFLERRVPTPTEKEAQRIEAEKRRVQFEFKPQDQPQFVPWGQQPKE